MEFEKLAESEDITKKVLKEGVGEPPNDGLEVYFFYIMRDLDGGFITGTETQHFRAVLGQGQLHSFLEIALQSMKLGERAVFRVAKAEEVARPNGIELEVEIVRLGNRRTSNWDLNSEQREQKATNLRNQGNEYIKVKNFEGARDCYEEGLKLIREDSFDEVKQALLNNLSLAYLKTNSFEQCAEISTEALELQPKNVKLYYRRAQALAHLERYDEAVQDYETALRLEPENTDIRKELEGVHSKRRAREQKDKQVYKKMFSD